MMINFVLNVFYCNKRFEGKEGRQTLGQESWVLSYSPDSSFHCVTL